MLRMKGLLQGTLVLLAIFLVIGVYTIVTDTPLLQAEPDEKTRVGFVDIRRVFENHPETMLAEMQLGREAQELQEELEKTIEEEDLTAEEQEDLLQEFQYKLAMREQELINEVVVQIEGKVREVAVEMGIDVVLEAQNVIFGGEDITRNVLEKIADAE